MKILIKENSCVRFYNETIPLYIKTCSSGVGLGAGLLQIKKKNEIDEVPENIILRLIGFGRKTLLKEDSAPLLGVH